MTATALTNYNQIYARSGYGPTDIIACFVCSTYKSRVYGQNDLTLFRGNEHVLINRMNLFAHSYAPPCMRNIVVFYDSTGKMLPVIEDGDTHYEVLATCTDNGDGSYTGECAKAWADPRVTLSKRTVAFDMPNRTVIVTDEVKCDASLTPHVCWNMPDEPVFSGTPSSQAVNAVPTPGVTRVTFGPAVLEFDTPQTVIAIGGIGHEIDGLDGATMATAITPQDLDWLGLSVADKLRSGGFWRVQCEMAAGGGTLTTKIVVN